mgnify:CR=1 FL=1
MGGAARFPLEFDQGFAMLLPHAQQMRTCSRILSLEAHVKAHQGDAKGTTEALLALATIDKSLENQPVLVSQLVCVALQGIATNLTGRLLPYVDFSDEDLVRLRRVFQQDDFKSGIAHGVIGERVIGSEAFKSPAKSLGPDTGLPNRSFFRGSNEDLAFYLEIQTDLHEAMETGYPAALDHVDKVHDKLMVKLDTPFGKIRYIMTGLTLPATTAAVRAAARGDARNRCIDTAIAIEQFRRREGKLPETLDELVPDFLESVPLDPFDGKPIRYVVKTDAYLLYTCGRDRVDDGGIEDDQMTDEVLRIDLKPSDEASEDSSSAGRDKNEVESADVLPGENPE